MFRQQPGQCFCKQAARFCKCTFSSSSKYCVDFGFDTTNLVNILLTSRLPAWRERTPREQVPRPFRTRLAPSGAVGGGARGDPRPVRGPRLRALAKLWRARSRLYRSQLLQVNMRLKALAEIYTMHSFAQLCNLNFLSNF